ncbi:MAG: hypothetical protein ABEJ74_02880 [Haloferacaceae archaeon]
MPSVRPFIDAESGGLDTDQIWNEALPVAGLVALFGGLALLPFLLVVVFAGNSALGVLFTIVSQFVLAVGAAVVLIYVVARGVQLADA